MGIFKKPRFANGIPTVKLEAITLEDGTVVDITSEVNAIGSTCPGPQLKVLKALGESAPGDVVSIQIDNPTSLETIVPMCSQLGATHLGTLSEDRSWRVLLEKNV